MHKLIGICKTMPQTPILSLSPINRDVPLDTKKIKPALPAGRKSHGCACLRTKNGRSTAKPCKLGSPQAGIFLYTQLFKFGNE